MSKSEHPVHAALIGQSVRRREDPRFLTGRGRYTDDVPIARLAHAAVLRSPYGHAQIKSIDTSAALAMDGVIGVLTYADIEGKVGDIRPNWVVGDSIVPEHPALAAERVRHVGEAVAFVVANTREQAADALEAILVDYDVLPAVVDEEAALQPDAPQLHAKVPGNLIGTYKAGGGDYAAAAASADRLVSLRLVNQRLIPSAIEPRAVRASYDATEERLTIYLPRRCRTCPGAGSRRPCAGPRTSSTSSRPTSAAASARRCTSIPKRSWWPSRPGTSSGR